MEAHAGKYNEKEMNVICELVSVQLGSITSRCWGSQRLNQQSNAENMNTNNSLMKRALPSVENITREILQN